MCDDGARGQSGLPLAGGPFVLAAGPACLRPAAVWGCFVDIHALEAFCRAFDEGSFSRACEGLFISRQALSRIMRTLEREVGAPLFVRRAAGVEPTELARMIEPHARRILEEHEAIQADIRKHAQGLAGCLALAIEPNAMMTLPTGVLERYRQARPDMAVTTVTASGSSVLEGLASGAVDAVVSVPMGDEAFAYLPVRREPLCVVLRAQEAPGAPAGGEDPADAADEAAASGREPAGGLASAGHETAATSLGALRGTTLFGVAQDHPIESQIGAYLARRGVPVRLSYDYPSAMLAFEAMEAGLGGCIMTASAASRFLERGCRVVALEGQDAPQWEVGVTYRRGSSKQAAIADLARYLGE